MARIRYLNIAVSCYSGYLVNEKPLAFAIEGQRYTVEKIFRRWRTPTGERWFEVQVADGRRFLLGYNTRRDSWMAEEKAERRSNSEDPPK